MVPPASVNKRDVTLGVKLDLLVYELATARIISSLSGA